MINQNGNLGEGLTLLSVTIANAIGSEFSKDDIFIIAAFLSSVAANLYLIANTRLSLSGAITTATDQGEAEAGI